MYADRTMCELLGVHPSISPEDCYDVWFAGISPNYVAAVLDNVDIVRRDGYSEITYTWNHPARGLIWVRCGGVFFHNSPDGRFLDPRVFIRMLPPRSEVNCVIRA